MKLEEKHQLLNKLISDPELAKLLSEMIRRDEEDKRRNQKLLKWLFAPLLIICTFMIVVDIFFGTGPDGADQNILIPMLTIAIIVAALVGFALWVWNAIYGSNG